MAPEHRVGARKSSHHPRWLLPSGTPPHRDCRWPAKCLDSRNVRDTNENTYLHPKASIPPGITTLHGVAKAPHEAKELDSCQEQGRAASAQPCHLPLLLFPLPGKHKPGEPRRALSSTNLAEYFLHRSKESCQPLGLMHAAGQDKRALGFDSRRHHRCSSSRHTAWVTLLYTLPRESLVLSLLHSASWLHLLQGIGSGEDQDSCGVAPVLSVPEESKLGSAPPGAPREGRGLGVVCLDERQDILL